jgi:tetratricopeptide (TPR) repeat protein
MLTPRPSNSFTTLDVVIEAWLTDLDDQRDVLCAAPLDEEQLARVAAGTCPPDEAEAVRVHVATCLPCLSAYAELVSAGDAGGSDDRSVGGGTFVGRRGELERLHAIMDTVSAGGGQIVCLTGPAGIGKSRLLDEFEASVAAMGMRVIRALCSPHGSSTPYDPVIDLVRALCRVEDGDSADVARGRIVTALRHAGLNAAGTAPFIFRLAGLGDDADLGVVPDPSMMKDKVALILRALILQAAQDVPMVIRMEDLQWCDAASAACLTRLFGAVRAGRVLFVGTNRSDHVPDWLAAAEPVTMPVPPFTPLEAEEFLGTLIDPAVVTPAESAAILARASGNPLVLEEMALALRTERRSEALSVASSGPRILQVRLQALDAEARRLLHAAAVIGIRGSLDLLGAVMGRDVLFSRALGTLEAQGFLVTLSEDDEWQFRFRHALVQETVYADVDGGERAALHGAVGRALEARHPAASGTITEALARHFAGSDDDERAVRYAIVTARQMTRRGANAEAVLLLEAALDRVTRMPETPARRIAHIDVVLEQAEARFGLGQHGRQIDAMRAIASIVEESADAPRQATWHYWMGFLQTLTGGRPDDAIEHCQTASRIADGAGIEDVYAYSESCLSQVLGTAGELREAVEHGKRAVAIFESTRNAWWACRTLWHLAAATLALGQWHESEAFCQRALEHGRSVSDSRLMAVAWLRLGAAQAHRGEWQTGLLFCDEAARLPHTEFDAAMLKVNRGYALVRGRQEAAGLASIEAGVEWFRRAGLRLSALTATVRLADAHVRAGNASTAARLAREVLASVRSLGYRHLEAVALAVLGEALVDVDPREADATLAHAAGVLEEIGALNDLARVRMAEARLARAASDTPRAITLIRTALRLFETLGTTDEVARARAALARAQGRPDA